MGKDSPGSPGSPNNYICWFRLKKLPNILPFCLAISVVPRLSLRLFCRWLCLPVDYSSTSQSVVPVKLWVCVVHLRDGEDSEMDISPVPFGPEYSRRFPVNVTSRQTQRRTFTATIIFYFSKNVSLCSPGSPWIHNPLASASQMTDNRPAPQYLLYFNNWEQYLPNFFPDRFLSNKGYKYNKILPLFFTFLKKM